MRSARFFSAQPRFTDITVSSITRARLGELLTLCASLSFPYAPASSVAAASTGVGRSGRRIVSAKQAAIKPMQPPTKKAY